MSEDFSIWMFGFLTGILIVTEVIKIYLENKRYQESKK